MYCFRGEEKQSGQILAFQSKTQESLKLFSGLELQDRY